MKHSSLVDLLHLRFIKVTRKDKARLLNDRKDHFKLQENVYLAQFVTTSSVHSFDRCLLRHNCIHILSLQLTCLVENFEII